MSAENREVDRLLDLLFSLPASERAAALHRECADPELRATLEVLLRSYDRAATFDTPVLELVRPGAIIADRFTVERHLGAGSFGSVWLCRDPHGSRCAIKMPRRDRLSDPTTVAAFKREVIRWIRLGDHPHVVHAYGMVDFLRLPAVVLEYIADAVSLDDALRSAPFEWRSSVSIGQQIAAGMAHAHARTGLVHNDLKPGNVLIMRGGHVKVTDFGIAVAHAIESPSAESELGSIPYMPPERWLGRQADTRSDIYSFGVLMFEITAGKRPFPDRGDPNASADDHVSAPPPDLRSIVPDVPAPIAALIGRCLAKDPARRPQDFASLVRELGHVAAQFGVPGPDSTAALAVARPNRAEAATNVAMTLLEDKRVDEAAAAAQEAVAADPEYAPAWHALGNAMLEAKRWQDAIRAFLRVQQLDPKDLRAVQGIVLAYLGAGSEREAMAWLTQALARAHDANALEQLELIPHALLELDDSAMALRMADAILERNPLLVRVWNSRAIALRRLGGYAEALSSVERALDLNQAYAPGWTNRANVLIELGEFAEAAACADNALSLDKTLANAYLAKAAALQALGDTTEAEACLREGLQYRPDNLKLHTALGRVRAVAATDTGERTVLQELIDTGVYRASAGQEALGYFDPSFAPFQVFASRVGVDAAAGQAMADRLGVLSAQQVLEVFETALAHELLQAFLMETTIEPFFLRYSVGTPVGIFEVARELQFNSLAALLLHHPACAEVESPAGFANALADVMANEEKG